MPENIIGWYLTNIALGPANKFNSTTQINPGFVHLNTYFASTTYFLE